MQSIEPGGGPFDIGSRSKRDSDRGQPSVGSAGRQHCRGLAFSPMSAPGWRVAIVAGWSASLVCAFVAVACGGRVGSEPGQSGLSADEGGSTVLLDAAAEVSLLDSARMDSAIEG